MNTISNNENILDSRAIIQRIEELEEIEHPSTEEAEELATLSRLASEGQKYADDWMYGVVLIHSDYFTAYCRELVQDIGDVPADLPSYLEIDWDATADNLKVDYTEIDFGGEVYFIR